MENDNNEVRYLTEGKNGSTGHYVAQWNDDIHHALHVLLTGEKSGYYSDYADEPIRRLGRCLAEGFCYQGESSLYRNHKPRGEPSSKMPPTAFVSFLQNHDQVGNRHCGERITSLVQEYHVRLAAALLLLAPSPPLLFMGEEFFATTPFFFFCDFTEDLIQAVINGRYREIIYLFQRSDQNNQDNIPEPNDPEAFKQSCLCWQDLDTSRGRQWFSFYKRLVEIRKRDVIPRLHEIESGKAEYQLIGPKAVDVWWSLVKGSRLRIIVNFSENVIEDGCFLCGTVFYQDPVLQVMNKEWKSIPGQSICSFIQAPGESD